ncbi:MAG: hypothetical protein MJ164_03300 [Alphaproteobacteria bacterium]|nr:hypothetical protein [Alphaproteobacteria bacterium]
MPNFYKPGDFASFRSQTPSDKWEIIANAKNTIKNMKERLETEKNEKIRQRCHDIINECYDTIAREQEAIKIISRSARVKNNQR